MIRKELDDLIPSDKYEAAGRRAEEQMAFYLKRFFQAADDIVVLNSIRLERDGDAAQMDHLVIHAHGLIIVESKSVSGKVQVKDDGQWVRHYADNTSGMQSPLFQARLQQKFLRAELAIATRQGDLMQKLPIDLLVAISDKGEILWPRSGALPEVCKADQVADRIEARIAELAAAKAGQWFTGANLQKISDFLCKVHKPLKARQPATTGQPVPVFVGPVHPCAQPGAPAMVADKPAHSWGTKARLPAGKTCPKCASPKLEIRFAHSYHFHCHACGKNSPIHETCSTCREPVKLRKKGAEFFLDCAKCKTSQGYFVNGAGAAAA